MKFARALLAWVALASFGAGAACTGAGITWSCAAGTTSAEITTALSSASDGATLTFANGSYTWSSFVSLSNTKGATLVCQSVGGCDVAATGTVLGMNGSLSGNNTKTYRISGFDFNQGGGAGPTIWIYGAGTLNSLRIDNNTFTNYADTGTVMLLGENATVASIYGVIDHNTVTNATNVQLANIFGALNSSVPASTAGSSSNLFFENNTLTFTTTSNAGHGCIDGWGGDAIVWRYNTTTNCLVTQHGVLHGGGPWNFELYNNTFIVNAGATGLEDCYRCFHHQGSGEIIAFNNAYTPHTGKSSVALSVMHYRSSPVGTIGVADPPGQCDGNHVANYADGNRSPIGTYRGYPCYRQPGRNGNAVAKPMYAWNNYWSDTLAKIDMAIEAGGGSPDYIATHVVANRDYFNAVSKDAQTSASAPFDGTTGMGFGTIARRPTTCTTGTEAADAGNVGVGYYATDESKLYICTATDTWTLHYQPYTYPHPLVGGLLPAPGNPRGHAVWWRQWIHDWVSAWQN